MSGWRYIATRLNGDGTETVIDPNLPLKGATPTTRVSGAHEISGALDLPYASLVGPDGTLLVEEWGTAVYAEYEGAIMAGGIVTSAPVVGNTLQVNCAGFTAYPHGMPYNGSKFWVETDPLVFVREAWHHLQSYPGGNLGMQVDVTTTTPVRRGTELRQAEFDTQNGPVSFESGPYRFSWYETDDLGKAIDDLAESTPFDFRERHDWVGDSEVIGHYLDFGYPRLGAQLEGLRFVEGENVRVLPERGRDGSIYASEVYVLGAGEGREMVRGYGTRSRGSRLRRATVVTDKSLRSKRDADARGNAEAGLRSAKESISEIVVTDHPGAPFGSWNDGDDIIVSLRDGYSDLDVWARVLATTYSPGEGGARLSVQRTDMIAA